MPERLRAGSVRVAMQIEEKTRKVTSTGAWQELAAARSCRRRPDASLQFRETRPWWWSPVHPPETLAEHRKPLLLRYLPAESRTALPPSDPRRCGPHWDETARGALRAQEPPPPESRSSAPPGGYCRNPGPAAQDSASATPGLPGALGLPRVRSRAVTAASPPH